MPTHIKSFRKIEFQQKSVHHAHALHYYYKSRIEWIYKWMKNMYCIYTCNCYLNIIHNNKQVYTDLYHYNIILVRWGWISRHLFIIHAIKCIRKKKYVYIKLSFKYRAVWFFSCGHPMCSTSVLWFFFAIWLFCCEALSINFC